MEANESTQIPEEIPSLIDTEKPSPSKFHKLKYIIIGVLILSIGLAGGVYVSRNLLEVQNMDSKSDQVVSTPSAAPTISTLTPVPKGGLNKYTNEKLGFSFEYYSGQMLLKECDLKGQSLPKIDIDLPERHGNCTTPTFLDIKILDKDFKLDQLDYESHQVATKIIQVGSRDFLQYTGIRKDRVGFVDGMGTSAISKFIYIPIKHNNMNFLISLIIIDEREIIYKESLLNQILSTFEFIDKNTLVSTPIITPSPTTQASIKTIQHAAIPNWKTYTSKAGYTIQHSPGFEFSSETKKDNVCSAYFSDNTGGVLSSKVVPYDGGSRRELYGIEPGYSHVFEDVYIQGVKSLIIGKGYGDYSGSGTGGVIPKGKYALILSWDHREKDGEDFQNLLKSISITELTGACE